MQRNRGKQQNGKGVPICPRSVLSSPRVIKDQFAAAAAAAAAKSLQSCPTLCNPRDGSPPGFPFSGILQARTRVDCHFLLQCMKVKSESEVSQSCPTLSDPKDCSLPASSIHGIFQARVLEWGAIVFLPKASVSHNDGCLISFSHHKNHLRLS